METTIRIDSILENSIFGNFKGTYFGEIIEVKSSQEGKASLVKNLNNKDEVIVNTLPVKETFEVGKTYKVISLSSLTAYNVNQPITLNVTKQISVLPDCL